MQALNQESVDASALTIFSIARAILKSNGNKQEPAIGGSTDRQEQTLFGIKEGLLTDFSIVPVITAKAKDSIVLEAGFALGLYKNNELDMTGKNAKPIRLRVDSVLGISRSVATVIKGNY